MLTLIHDFWSSLQGGQFLYVGFWPYALLAVSVAVEGPIATLLGAAVASAGFMRLPLVFASAAAGNVTADVLWYSLGYAGKIDWLLRYGRWLGLRDHHLERLQQGMQAHSPKFLLAAKLTAGFIIPSLIAAGLARVPWRRWLPVLLLGEMIWTGGLTLAGYYATEAIKQIERGVQYVVIVSSTFFLLAVLWLIARALRQDDQVTGTSQSGCQSPDKKP